MKRLLSDASLPSSTARDTFVDDQTLGPLLGLSPSYLRQLRVKGNGPPYVRLAAKAIRYNVGDALAWAAARTARSTSDYGASAFQPATQA